MSKLTIDGRALARAPDGSRVVSFRASTGALDRHGTIIRPEGIHTEKFDRNSIFVWAHDGYGSMFGGPSMDSILGRVVGHRKTKDAFDIDVEFATADVNPKAEQAFRLVNAGFLSAVSIGFIPINHHEEEVEGRGMTQILDEVELLEVSLVPIPSNPEALSLMRAMLQHDSPEDRVLASMTPELRAIMRENNIPEVMSLARHMFGHRAISKHDIDAASVLLRIGKVLSTINEQRLRRAKQEIDDCLSTLEKIQEGSEEQPTPQPPAMHAADAGAVTTAIKAAFGDARKSTRIQEVLANAFRKASP